MARSARRGDAGLEFEIAERAYVHEGRIYGAEPEGFGAEGVSEIEGYAIPGLADLHCHVGLDESGATDHALAIQQATTDRDTGVLLQRDAGSPLDTRFVQERADLPRLVRCGRHLARPKRYLRNYAWEIEPEALVEYAVAQVAAGDGWVKLVGDWIDREAGDLKACWPTEALTVAIDAVHAAGGRVTAHCFSHESLPGLLEAGIDCVEHATGLTAETIPLFAEHGVAIVPTLVNIGQFLDYAEAGHRFPAYAAHMRTLHAHRYETIAAAHAAGVQIFAGTDAGGVLPHGIIASELAELHRAGLSAAEVLAAAAFDARTYLGFDTLTDGASADLVVYSTNPQDDVRAYEEPRAVVLRGQRVR
ncbi:amidohydrolase family protein [Micrococcales bacterium 31B]|nr:amidohydrolase family protein [Micrococcales bacterium 31B]